MRHLHGAQCNNGAQSQRALRLLPRGLRLRVCCCVPHVQQGGDQNPHLRGTVGTAISGDDLAPPDVAAVAAAGGAGEGGAAILAL